MRIYRDDWSKRSQSLAGTQAGATGETPQRGSFQPNRSFDSSLQASASRGAAGPTPARQQSPSPGKQLQAPSTDRLSSRSSSRPSSGELEEDIEESQKDMAVRRKSGIPGLHKNFRSATNLSFKDELSVAEGPPEPPVAATPKKLPRPTSAGGRTRHSSLTPVSFSRESTSRGSSPEKDGPYCGEDTVGGQRGRGRDFSNIPSKQTRSRSVGPTELSRQLNKTAPASLSVKKTSSFTKTREQKTLLIARDTSGRHRIAGGVNGTDKSQTQGDDARRSQRVAKTPDRILPDKPKMMNRSQTIDIASVVGDENSSLQENGSGAPVKYHRQRSSSTSCANLSLATHIDDYGEAPPEDEAAYYEMEKVFEELLRQEMAKNGPCLKQRSKSEDILDYDDPSDSYADYTQQSFQKGRQRLDSNSSRESSMSRGGSPMRVVKPADSRGATTSNTPGTPRRRSSPNVLGKATLTPYKSVSGRSSPATSRESSAPSSPKKSPSGSRENLINKGSSRRPMSAKSRTTSNYKYHSQENLLDSDGGQAAARRSSFQARARSQSRDNLLETPRKPLTKSSKSRSSSRENILDDRSLTPARAQRSNSSVSLPSRKSPAKDPQPVRSHSFQKQTQSRDLSVTPRNASRRSPARELSAQAQHEHEEMLRAQDKITQTMDLLGREEKPRLVDIEVDTSKEETKAKPRRDDRHEGNRTGIPMPVSMRDKVKEEDSYGQPLRRYDSGVDINNMSPTEASIHGDEAWQQDMVVVASEAMGMANHSMTSLANDPDYF